MLQFQLSRQTGLVSAAIAWFSSGWPSHIDVVLPTGELLGARSDNVGGGSGVRVRPPDYAPFARKCRLRREAAPEQERRFYAFLRAQVGKPYDSTAIVGFVAGRDWRDPSAWFCAELAMAAVEHAGLCSLLFLTANKITPVGAGLVLSALGFNGWDDEVD